MSCPRLATGNHGSPFSYLSAKCHGFFWKDNGLTPSFIFQWFLIQHCRSFRMVSRDVPKNQQSLRKLALHGTKNIIWIVGKPTIITGVVQLVLTKILFVRDVSPFFFQSSTRITLMQVTLFQYQVVFSRPTMTYLSGCVLPRPQQLGCIEKIPTNKRLQNLRKSGQC